ncbi:hypothetical protein BAUCODRAFT_335330 [Baudoinia panamericana UAMH 10762]|uniref:Uncharacterized protein n=1 Tax=Baudoinia panamericana (strain UAMH 10762) TaxID=717646 RepID=M2MX76_BAUPA|nr:uncharacterized protein BAUCODRAFT_335330 [Baudoinia panamericana UAMH 10762]EMC90855.1 hypothetical protein BAUCODRAFT_335330 [Baudoinia panamericana UAMH 10762]
MTQSSRSVSFASSVEEYDDYYDTPVAPATSPRAIARQQALTELFTAPLRVPLDTLDPNDQPYAPTDPSDDDENDEEYDYDYESVTYHRPTDQHRWTEEDLMTLRNDRVEAEAVREMFYVVNGVNMTGTDEIPGEVYVPPPSDEPADDERSEPDVALSTVEVLAMHDCFLPSTLGDPSADPASPQTALFERMIVETAHSIEGESGDARAIRNSDQCEGQQYEMARETVVAMIRSVNDYLPEEEHDFAFDSLRAAIRRCERHNSERVREFAGAVAEYDIVMQHEANEGVLSDSDEE